MKRCLVDDCFNKAVCRKYCDKHYRMWKKYGDPLFAKITPGTTQKWLLSKKNTESEECIIWPFALDAWGYGVCSFMNEYRASRVMCKLTYGEPPSRLHEAAHSCGNRSCINPKHLRWATPIENYNDKLYHGTHSIGDNNGRAKLTNDDIRFIRVCSLSRKEIMKKFGLSKSQVYKIINRTAWSHIQ